ncbi:Carboxylesterase [Marasmius fiardii PR-910]|nr:Carboxylesterase [Marasmius fiardii PR-910]
MSAVGIRLRQTLALAVLLTPVILVNAIGDPTSITISTTSGRLKGLEQDGVMSFKGIRYGLPPTGSRRWEPPMAFVTSGEQNATKLGPSCIQQFLPGASGNLQRQIFNSPPPPESEDCLFLNVWSPANSRSTSTKRPVLVWIHGGGLAFGTASAPIYDGTSIASNQGVVVVSINYRTNVFGFPSSPELPLRGNNLGLLDQELALAWIQLNADKFGGDPRQVTIMGQSAGGLSVSTLLARHGGEVRPPFRAAIMLSGNIGSISPLNPTSFNQFAAMVNCTQAPGTERLACLKDIPASVISALLNGPTSILFGAAVIDNFTVFDRPIERIAAKKTARVPVLIGNTKDDGSLLAFGVGAVNLAQFLEAQFQGAASEQLVRSLYPGLNDTTIISSVLRDFILQCPAGLWAAASVQSRITNVYRYIYGAVFSDLQVIPGAGAAHASELPELFGTFNRTTATDEEVTLSSTFQTAIVNFVKNPNDSPAPGWTSYGDGNVAELAFAGNVNLDDVVQLVKNNSVIIVLPPKICFNSGVVQRNLS